MLHGPGALQCLAGATRPPKGAAACGATKAQHALTTLDRLSPGTHAVTRAGSALNHADTIVGQCTHAAVLSRLRGGFYRETRRTRAWAGRQEHREHGNEKGLLSKHPGELLLRGCCNGAVVLTVGVEASDVVVRAWRTGEAIVNRGGYSGHTAGGTLLSVARARAALASRWRMARARFRGPRARGPLLTATKRPANVAALHRDQSQRPRAVVSCGARCRGRPSASRGSCMVGSRRSQSRGRPRSAPLPLKARKKGVVAHSAQSQGCLVAQRRAEGGTDVGRFLQCWIACMAHLTGCSRSSSHIHAASCVRTPGPAS